MNAINSSLKLGQGNPKLAENQTTGIWSFKSNPPSAPQDVDWSTGNSEAIVVTRTSGVKIVFYFGLGQDRHTSVAKSVFDDFLKEVVAVEFPGGSFDTDGRGAYHGFLEESVKLEAIVVAVGEDSLRRIAGAWMERAHQAEVLAVVTKIEEGGAQRQ